MRKQRKNDIVPLWISNNRLFMAIRNFIFQGILYMTWPERAYKAMIDICLFLIFINFFNFVHSLIFAHAINYVLNGQFFVLTRYLFNSALMTEKKIILTMSLADKLKGFFDIKDILITGSGCRNCMTKNSDLDLRVFHSCKPISTLKALIYANILRAYGTFIGCAVDIYCFSNPSFIEKLDKKEKPISIYKNLELQLSAYREISFSPFNPKILT